MGKKITQLATITEVADDDLIVGVDVSDTSGSDNGTNKKFTKATLLDGLAPLNPQLTGWNPDAETWVYHSVDDPTGYFKIEDKDVSANYSVGWRIMFTNGGNVIKGIITAITYSDPDTIITFLHEIDPTDNQALYLLQNSAITENYVSPHKAPLGFPLSPAKWSVVVTYDTQKNTSSATFVAMDSTNLAISVPIGSWEVSWNAVIGGLTNPGTGTTIEAALSSSTGAASHVGLWAYSRNTGASGSMRDYRTIYQKELVVLTSKTPFYVIGRITEGNSMYIFSQYVNTKLSATCAYL